VAAKAMDPFLKNLMFEGYLGKKSENYRPFPYPKDDKISELELRKT
jgi:hypothetical protein